MSFFSTVPLITNGNILFPPFLTEKPVTKDRFVRKKERKSVRSVCPELLSFIAYNLEIEGREKICYYHAGSIDRWLPAHGVEA